MSTGRTVAVAVFASLLSLLPVHAFGALVTLTGKVTDANGVGIFGVQINFVDSCTGVTAGASGNITSSIGTFTATVSAGVYDLEFVPPAGSLFTADRILHFDLTSSRTLATIALPYGVLVSGKVTDTSGIPLSNVYLHFFPPGGSERIYTAHDRTDTSGNYAVVVLPGTYDLHYGPPAGTRYLALSKPSVPIPGNTTLATVALAGGLLVGGTVYDNLGPGHPVINVNLDVVDAVTGADVPLSHDRTDATGTYGITVPPGTYIVESKPEHCTSLVSQQSAPVTITADATLPQVVLQSGVIVKGYVTDSRANPIFDVNTNWFGSSGAQVYTTDDHTDATGFYSAVVPPDTYAIEYIPPVGLRLAGVKLTGVAIGNNPPQLATVALPDGFFITGRTITVSGAPVDNADLGFFVAGSTTQKVYVSHHHTDAAGSFQVVVVPGSYDLRLEPPTTSLAARRLFGLTVGPDLALGNIVMEEGFVVTGNVSDTHGSAVSNVDLDFYDAYTGVKVETPGDNTDTLGNYTVVVPPRVYNVHFTPPSGTPLETGRIAGVTITAPLSGLNIQLRDAFQVSGRVLNASSQGIGGVDLNFYLSGTSTRQTLSRDNTLPDGTYGFDSLGGPVLFVPPGTYDIVFTPPALSGYTQGRLNGVSVTSDTSLPDVILGSALAASVTSVAPSSGPANGGTAVTIDGSNFQPGAVVMLGGVLLTSVQVVSGTQITGVASSCPAGDAGGTVAVSVANPGAAAATLPGAFTCTPGPAPIDLTVTRGAPDIVLSWPATGQSSYTIYRSASPSQFGQAQILTTTTATTFTDVGGDADGVNYFYRVE